MDEKEFELQFLISDYKELKITLKEYGAIYKGTYLLVNRFYKSPSQPKAVVRIRSTGRKHYLTYKNTPENEKFATEYETRIKNWQETEAILLSLGLSKQRTSEKIRESYVKGKVRFEIDHYPGLEPYLEIEAESEALLVKTYSELGLKPAKISTKTEYLTLYGINTEELTNQGFEVAHTYPIRKNVKTFERILNKQMSLIE